ncbi:methyltransferase family protein [Buttiauxella sp. BIGb0552]|jgi:predicted RNA methylase|uniref:16S RNA G1207 methylase RsmC n=1 Tax=Buttiauxella agrestis TaxID=82977 RepID=A0A381KQF7_9ENTR|nr:MULTISPECIES: class I SAM-dependent methyltransferase [Buttiauxella]TDX11875.1 methyltransferase family protein [Buttiauxella sp. BIGb0552]SUY92841.1 16S RNA G1207 methylase RsmC [Buttiauxella agrestis]
MQITNDVLYVLGAARVEGNQLFLNGQLERSLYMRTDKVLKAAGGIWKRKEKAHIFTTDAADRIDEIMATGTVVVPHDEFNFFPTPAALIARMMKFVSPVNADRVLEPEYGDGRIIRAVLACAPEATVTGVEIREQPLSDLAAMPENVTLLRSDFLSYAPEVKYDAILMNPPFCKRQDVRHVNHALDLLAPKGRLSAVMSAGTKFRSDNMTTAFRARVAALGGRILDLEEGTFRQSGTNVNTVLVEVVMPG